MLRSSLDGSGCMAAIAWQTYRMCCDIDDFAAVLPRLILSLSPQFVADTCGKRSHDDDQADDDGLQRSVDLGEIHSHGHDCHKQGAKDRRLHGPDPAT